MRLATVQGMSQKEPHVFTPFTYELMKMDARFRVYPLFDDYLKNVGYCPTKEYIYMPVGLPSVAHEIAHMVEFRDMDRCLLPDWGLANFAAKIELPSSLFFAALSREIRVRAIQTHMESKLFKQLNRGLLDKHPFWEPAAMDRLPFGRFNTYEELCEWAQDLHTRTFSAWSLDRIRHEWQIRLAHIQNWMEIKEAA